MSKKDIIVFTLDGCEYCLSLKNRLKRHNIEFKEVEVTKNEKLWDMVVAQTGEDYVPTVFIRIEGTDEGNIYVPDRDFKDEDEIFKIIVKHLQKMI